MSQSPPSINLKKAKGTSGPRITWLLLLIPALAFFVTGGIFIFLAIQEIKQGVSSEHLEIARRAQLVIAGSLNHFLTEEQRAARDIVRNNNPHETLGILLKENPEFERASFITADGQEKVRVDRVSTVVAQDLKGYQETEGFGKTLAGNMYISPVFFSRLGEPLISVYAPVLSYRHDVIGVLEADLNLKFMWNLMGEIAVGAHGKVYVVDGHGAVIADPDSSLVLRGENVFSRPIVKKILAGDGKADGLSFDDSYKNFDGVMIFATGLRIDPTGWGVITEEPKSEALIASTRTLEVGVAFSAVTAILIVILVLFVLRILRLTQFLEREQAHTLSIITNLTDGLIEYSPTFEMVFINPAVERMLGVQAEAVKGKRISDEAFLGDPANASFNALFRDDKTHTVLDPSKEPHLKEVTLSSPFELTLEVTTLSIASAEGQVISYVKILHDVTREKLLNHMKSEFISIAAHQLRTPLSALKWTLRLLLDGDLGRLPVNQVEYIASAFDTNERMIRLVNDLLNVSRIEEGRFQFTFAETNLAELIESSISGLKEVAESKKISVMFEKPPSMSPVLIDKDKVEMVLQNLVENAIFYTQPKGRVNVAIRDLPDMVEVRVSDTGIGLAPAERAQLFTKFYRSEGASRLVPNGSGLGLFIARNIVLRHGGTIGVESEVGKGSTFYFTLPKKAAHAKAADIINLQL